MLTTGQIYETALAQSALDLNCEPGDLLKSANVIVRHEIKQGARVCYEEPLPFTLVSYGNNIVASVKDEYRGIINGYISGREFFRCFETPHIHALDAALLPLGQQTCFMAEYFLPDVKRLSPAGCPFEIRVLTRGEFAPYYLPEWSNALSASRPALDELCAGAFDGGRLIGLAGCSRDCDTMWQIGIDVLPAYRRQGVAAALVSRLALETLDRGKVPYYCRAWSNIPSGRTAIKSGFLPAWNELTAKPLDFCAKISG